MKIKKISDTAAHPYGDLGYIETNFSCQSRADDKVFNPKNSEAIIDRTDQINGLATLMDSVPETFNVDSLFDGELRADYATKNSAILGYLKPTDCLGNNSLDAFMVDPNYQSDFQSRHFIHGSIGMDAETSTFDHGMTAASIAGRQKEVSDKSILVDFCETASPNSIGVKTFYGGTPFTNSEIDTITNTNGFLNDDESMKTGIDGLNNREFAISDSIPNRDILKDDPSSVSAFLTSRGCISEDNSELYTDADRVYNSEYDVYNPYEGETGFVKQNAKPWESLAQLDYQENNFKDSYLIEGFVDGVRSNELMSESSTSAHFYELKVENATVIIPTNHSKDGYLAKTNAGADHLLTTTGVSINNENIMVNGRIDDSSVQSITGNIENSLCGSIQSKNTKNNHNSYLTTFDFEDAFKVVDERLAEFASSIENQHKGCHYGVEYTSSGESPVFIINIFIGGDVTGDQHHFGDKHIYN